MPFFVKVGDKEVSSADLPLSLYARVSKATGVGWYDLYNTPAADPEAGPAFVKAVAEHLGMGDVAAPATPKELFDCFRFVSDREAMDLPTATEDGIPSPEAGQATT